jgi:hypothetical protein
MVEEEFDITPKIIKNKRKRFSEQAILKRLVDVKAECKKCHRTARQTQLDLHHKDGDSSNDDWTNIVIYCRACHNDKEGTIPRKRDR